MRHILIRSVLAVSAASTLACGYNARAPLTPSPAVGNDASALEAATIGATRLKATKPVPVSPIDGIVVDDTSPDLTVQHARGIFVDGLQFSYVFRVWDEDGVLVYESPEIPQGPGDTTSIEVDKDIDYNEEHTWEVQSFLGERPGPTSDTALFKTHDVPSYGPSCAHLVDPLAIVLCRKVSYGFVEHHQLNDFLRGVAFDLNRAGHEHAPFGLLQKPGGNNCNGYSCDIVCSDAGGMQRQWDILIDEDAAQIPAWNRVGTINVRVCEPVPY